MLFSHLYYWAIMIFTLWHALTVKEQYFFFLYSISTLSEEFSLISFLFYFIMICVAVHVKLILVFHKSLLMLRIFFIKTRQ